MTLIFYQKKWTRNGGNSPLERRTICGSALTLAYLCKVKETKTEKGTVHTSDTNVFHRLVTAFEVAWKTS